MQLNEIFSKIPLVNYNQISTIKEDSVKTELKNKFDKLLEFIDNKKNNTVIKLEKPNMETSTETLIETPTETLIKELKKSDNKSKFLKLLEIFSQSNDISEQEKKDLILLAQLESSFRLNPHENNIALGYFQITPKNLEKYGINDLNTFRSDPLLLFEIAFKHYKNTLREAKSLKKLAPELSNFQLIYGLWFTGFPNMKKHLLNKSYDPSDGKIKLSQALIKAKNVEQNQN